MKIGNPRHRSDGCWVADWLVIRPEISDSAKLLYARLVRWWSPKKKCTFLPQEDLAGQLGKSVRTVQRLMGELIAFELIVLRRKKSFANLYDILFNIEHPWMEDEDYGDANSGISGDTESVASNTPTLTHSEPKLASPNLLDLVKNKEKNPPTPSSEGAGGRGSRVSQVEAFTGEFNETFWPGYGKRPGNPRKESLASFIRARRDGASLSEIMSGLEAHKAMWLREGRAPEKKPMASTWLNQERWRDDASADPSAPSAGGMVTIPGAQHLLRPITGYERSKMDFNGIKRLAEQAFGRQTTAQERRAVCDALGCNPFILQG